jgi:hypothetical protein
MKRVPPSLLPIAAAAALVLGCGSLSFEPLSGGSGAGNPGNTVVSSAQVVLSLSAQGTQNQVIGKSALLAKTTITLDTPQTIIVPDRGGIFFRLTQVTLSNVEPLFMLDSTIRPDSLLRNMKEPPPGLSWDSNCILLYGPHELDAVGGGIDSGEGMLRLPVARYTGIGIGFHEFNNTFPHRPPPPEVSRISMRGTFLWGGSLHALIIDINYNYAHEPCVQRFWFGGGLFTLSTEDTTHLELRFEAEKWFSSVDFGNALGTGMLLFDPAGALRITDGFPNPVVQSILSAISADFFASGRLVVY